MPEMVGGVNRDELETVALDVAAGLLQDLDVEVNLEWLHEDRPTLWVAVEGKDAKALVGSRARTLHSLQYLFRALIYHRLDGDYNLVVDANAYRKRRRRSLETLAKRQAEKAVETGETVRLRAMPAHERRIVHITLRDDDRVTTESVGRGRNRSVTVIPQRPISSS
jgi:spoIIIJ-associated protein